MKYHKILEKHDISEADINTLVKHFAERAAKDSSNLQPDAVYHSAAIDIALGAVDMSEETLGAMKTGHSAKGWIEVLTGIKL